MILDSRFKIFGVASAAIFLFSIFYFLFFFTMPALALDRTDEAIRDIVGQTAVAGAKSGLGLRDVRLTVALVIAYSLSVLGVIFLVLIVYAGFLWMTAGGEEEKITKALKIIKNAIIGLLITLSAFAIEIFVFRVLVRSTTNDPCYEPLGYEREVTGGGLSRYTSGEASRMENIFCSR